MTERTANTRFAVLAGFVAVIVFAALALGLAAPGKALALSESEPNNSMGTADKIHANEWVYGKNDANGVGDYFKFELPASGTVVFQFASTKAYDTWNSHGFLVYDKYHRCVASANFYQTNTAIDSIVPTRLSKGTYYIGIDDFSYEAYRNHPYKFKVKYSFAGASVTKVTSAKAKFTARWSKVSGAVAYQVRYSTAKSMSGAKTLNVSKGASAKTVKVKAKKTYYVQVRVAKKAGGKTYWSTWSAKKAVRTK